MDFTTLFSFLERFGAEVGGREICQPEDQMAAKLLRFAQGRCESSERAEVCEILRVNPALLRWLADQVRKGRPEMGQTPAAVD